MHRLVLLRHGESLWNRDNRFTGWTDVGLTDKGVTEAIEAGRVLKREGYVFDLAYTSVLKRAIKTLWLVLEEMDQIWLPVIHSWRLNERHYGALQGLNKADTVAKYGLEQVHIWRRSYDVRPPALNLDDDRYPGKDTRYVGLESQEIPLTECLKDTVERFMPYWQQTIVPQVKSDKNVIIAAHGNSLRALIKHLENISDKDIVDLNIPTGIPLVYELEEDLKPIRHFYLGDPDVVRKAAQAVADQLKQKPQ